ncbi:MAG TPA: hypothetical protein VD813_11520 [Pseudonocardia sp.]|nr:hypothetical protein [Pseudonocardia sp.]
MTATTAGAPPPPAPAGPAARPRTPARAALLRPLWGAAVLAVVPGAAVAARIDLVVVALVAGAAAALALVAACAWRPILATYVYLLTLPLIAGIDRGNLLPLVRPNEALLVLVVAGAAVGGYLRLCRGDPWPLRAHPVDVPLVAFVLLYSVWPIASLMLRGLTPTGAELASALPMVKLFGLYLLVRFTVRTEEQVLRCVRFVVWPGAVIAVIAILQTLRFGPVVTALEAIWSPDATTGEITDRGTTTLSSPIATGDVIIICIVLLVCCSARNLLGKRERIVLGVVLSGGVLAAGQFSTWISAVVAAGLLLWRFPDLRRRAVRLLPFLPVPLLIGAPAFVGRLEGFTDLGLPVSWLGRWDNLSNFYLPAFGPVNWLIGVSPDSVLDAPETWRDVIYLEAGYLQFLWIGGIPLLLGFVWLSVAVLRSAARLIPRPDATGAVATALQVSWWFVLVLTVIDPHLTLRGTGDLLFTMLAVTTGSRYASREP